MSKKSHKRYLEQSALREAQKAIDRHGRTTFKREDFCNLRIQIVEPWKRIVALVIGAFFGVLTSIAIKDDYHLAAVIAFTATSLLFVIAGLIGYKKPVDAVIDAAADAGFDRLLDAIF